MAGTQSQQAEERPSQAANTPPRPTPEASGARKIVLVGVFALAAVILAALVLSWLRPPEMHGVVLQSPDRAADFTLMASTGQPMSLSDLRGKHLLLYFGYTFCPDVCPFTLNDLAKAKELLGRKGEDLQVVMITVDPERDTAEQLALYLPNFDPTFIGLTGEMEEIQAAASQFGIFFEKHEGSEATGYLVDHTASILLVDPEGYLREVFSYGTPPEDIAADLRYWMR